ncbi:HRSL1 enzyme, partial [Pachycephala philippinensis]|nr:HRSL1 enzyme [Pachycephala philippinensis]
MTQEKYYPRPGDLIEIKRLGYQHWALYVGCGYVIHVTAVDESAAPVSASSATLLTRRAKVKKDVLKEVAGDDDWGVNNKYDHYRTPFSMEEIVRRAERWIDVVVPYHLFLSNCEHFVTMLRYGEAVSEQVS